MQTSNVERITGYALAETKKNPASNPRYNVIVHSVRKTLADIDGISAKAALDACVRSGLLPDDSHKFIERITFTQEKCASQEEERTIIEFIEI